MTPGPGWGTLTDSLSVGAVLHGPGTSAAEGNSTAARILGLSPSGRRRLGARSGYWTPIDLQGRPLRREQHPALLSLADGRPRGVIPVGVKGSNGSWTWIGLRTSILEDGGVRQVLATFTDVSEVLTLVATPPGMLDPLESILSSLTGRLATSAMIVTEIQEKLYFVEACAHADPASQARLQADLAGTSFTLPADGFRSRAGVMAATAAFNWGKLRGHLAAHARPLTELFTGQECVYVDVPGSPSRAWLCLFRTQGAPALSLTEALEVRGVAAQAAGRLRLEVTLRRQTTAAIRLATLSLAERTLAASSTFEFALQNTLRLVVQGLEVDAGAVWLKGERGDASCAATTGFEHYDMRSERRRGHLLDPVLRGGGPVTSHRLSQEPMVRTQLVELEGFVFYHALPLTMRSQNLGAVELFRRSVQSPDEGWNEFVGLAAGCLATAVAVWQGASSPGDERRPVPAGLSLAQRRVLALALQGDDIAEMARTLHVTAHTIKYHLANLYRKLGVSDRVDLIAKAADQRWM